MGIQHDHELAVEELLDELHKAESKIVAVRAVINSGEPNWRRRCTDAAVALRALLAAPHTRPGSWEAETVTKLQDDLRAVLRTLEGEGGR